ncbi:MAG: hypothetical protein VKN72_09155 [Nostocales cyanobacterium 94392]|nr:hypothetical protein [Nostocales cyanobacterium 94392]
MLADVENIGKAGNITINVRDRMVVEGEGISAFANSTDIFPSQVTATVGSTGVGEGGEINISTGTLLVNDRAFITTSNFGIGKAGNINITADSVCATNEGTISSRTVAEAIGDGGNIKIIADSLSLTNGSDIVTSTFYTGKAGEITINLSDSLTIYSTGDVRNVSEDNQSSEWKKGEPIIEPQGVYKLASGELILSRECR